MWNWNIGKTFVLGTTTCLILIIAGFSFRASIIIALGFTTFANWLIREINFIREAHGTNQEELENEIEELKKKVVKK